MSGRDYFYIALGLAALWLAGRAIRGGEVLTEGAARLWEGVTFDPASLGESVQLTEGARLSQEQWIALGYLEMLPDGRTRITPAGQAYIDSQRGAP